MKQVILTPKRLLPFILLLVGAIVHTHAEDSGNIYVYTPNGTEHSFVLDNIQKITFSEQNLKIYSVDGNSEDFAFSDISKLTFKSSNIGNETTIADSGVNVKVYTDASRLIIESAIEISIVNLFDLQGKLLRHTAPQSPSVSIELPSLSGIYVVQIFTQQGVSVHKVVKR